ncbi:MAG: DUF5615 family PIN-like protein [Bryobacteraceae bacterium]
MNSARDVELLAYARQQGRTRVTLDLDFHQVLAESRSTGPSVILLRFQNLRAGATAELILRVLIARGAELEAGVAITVTPRGARLRKLPLKVPS